MGKRKTIVCLETGKQFNSMENAANAIGVSSGFISRQIKAGKPIKGFYYYYAGEMLPDEYRQKIRNRKKKPNYKSRPVICLETGERFESISLVSRMFGISKSNVFHAMKNGSAVHGIHFYRADEPKPDDSFFKPRRRRTVSVQLHPGWPVATTGNMPMTDSEWLHYRDLKSRCPACKRPAHIAKRDGNFYFVDDEYNPFVRHAPVKTTGAVFRFFANGYRREHGTEPKLTGNRKLSESDILSGMGAVSTKIDS